MAQLAGAAAADPAFLPALFPPQEALGGTLPLPLLAEGGALGAPFPAEVVRAGV